MSLINCEINLILSWAANYFISNGTVAIKCQHIEELIQNYLFWLQIYQLKRMQNYYIS